MSKERRFIDVSPDELRKAVAQMSKELGVSGSSVGYSLYEAVAKEHEKAIVHEKEQKQAFKEML